MKYKTLILKKGTKYQEFYGCFSIEGNLEWISGDVPINIFKDSITWDDIVKMYPDKVFSDVDLMSIEVNILT